MNSSFYLFICFESPISEANCRSTPRCLGYVVVGLWKHLMVKMESISIFLLCQLMDLSLVSVYPSQLRVNWMVLMIIVINWVSRIIRYGSKLVGQYPIDPWISMEWPTCGDRKV